MVAVGRGASASSLKRRFQLQNAASKAEIAPGYRRTTMHVNCLHGSDPALCSAIWERQALRVQTKSACNGLDMGRSQPVRLNNARRVGRSVGHALQTLVVLRERGLVRTPIGDGVNCLARPGGEGAGEAVMDPDPVPARVHEPRLAQHGQVT
ncbi:hypothetical protein NB231_09658 [Nitrococcus mobilis Nb-231]|uniref:Uncharacterized protein n=1 Tax=Nitrococcus mobilis Nb-231 TaxID=314278 RepID=A4BNA9_9GAMM|nr:hypothetical protein NB231_09658 [Nitrococcus mobilis Nb-231]